MDNNNENRYQFNIEEPAHSSFPSQPAAPNSNQEYRRIKKMIIRVAAVVCALSLVIGGGAGILIGGAMKSGDSADQQLSSNEENSDNTGLLNAVDDPTENTTSPSDVDQSNGNADRLLYVSGGSTSALSVKDVVAQVENSVVAIVINYKETTTYGFQTFYYDAQASGSGVIVSDDGYIVTNNHVISGAETITVTLADGTTYDAQLVAADDSTDLALIKIDASGLQAAEIGSSAELTKGETAVIIGNPLGYLDGSVSAGVISGLDRTLSFSDGTTLYHLIQTDASVNPGNSGGGLFNDRGQLVGIVTAKTSSTEVEGLGYAIPSDDFADIINDLYNYGYVKGRPALGITTINITNSMEAMYYGLGRTGIYVQNFVSKEAEEGSELRIGDCIVSINGIAVSNSNEILNILSEHEVGDSVEVEVYRDGSLLTVSTTLVEQDANY